MSGANLGDDVHELIGTGGRSVARASAKAEGFSANVPTAIECIELALRDGLFDLHWLDHCLLLDGVRQGSEYPAIRARVERADAILDALYGDHHIGTSKTAIAID